MKLKHKLNIVLSAAFVLIAFIFVGIQFYLHTQSTKALRETTMGILYTLVERDENVLANEIFEAESGFSEMKEAIDIRIRDMISLEGVIGIGVYSSDGKLIISEGNILGITHPLSLEILALKSNAIIRESTIGSLKVLIYVHKILAIGEPIGFIKVYYSLEKLQMQQNMTLILLTCLLFAIFFVVVLLLNYSVTRTIIDPIANLSDAMQLVRVGTLGGQVKVSTHDEIGKLAEKFNIMSNEVKQSYEQVELHKKQLEFLNADLEEQVKQRTMELEEKSKELEKLATHDALTGLYNRSKLNEIFSAELLRAERYGSQLGLILLDIDHFKSVNDNHGHQVGDQILKEFSYQLRRAIRKIDTIARWGGEEFLILCPETDLHGIKSVANKLKHAIVIHEFPIVGTKTASFGVAVYEKGDSLESLVAKADSALYLAKTNGRNRVESYSTC